MKIQNKYMQTHLDDMGRLLYYRVTFPIPKEFALSGIVKPGHVQEINSRYFYINQSQDYDVLQRCVLTCQLHVNNWKIKQLQKKKQWLQLKLEI